jgi:hypothetical protein
MHHSSRSRDRSMPKQIHTSFYPERYDNRNCHERPSSPTMADHFLQIEKERDQIRALFIQRYNESCEYYARKHEQG